MDGLSKKLVMIKSDVHARRLSEGLWDLFRSKTGLDYNFRWDGRNIRAHRIVLQLFLRSEMLDIDPVVKTEALNDDCSELLESVLEFMYRGEVSVPEERLEGLLEVASKLDFQMLVDAVVHFNFAREAMDESDIVEQDRMSDEILFEPILELVEPKVELPEEVEIKGEDQDFISASGVRAQWVEESSKAVSEDSVGVDMDDGLEIGDCVVQHDDSGGEYDDIAHQAFDNCDLSVISSSDFQPEEEQNESQATEWTIEFKSKSKTRVRIVTSEDRVVSKIFGCFRCEFETPLYKKYLRHLVAVHALTARGRPTQKYHCSEPDCDYEAVYQSDVKRHRETRHAAAKSFKCKHCNYATSWKRQLRVHGEVVHGLGDGRFTCETCGKRCATQTNLKVHYRSHTQERPFGCPHCEFAAAQKSDLKKHMDLLHFNPSTARTPTSAPSTKADSIQHEDASVKPFSCPYCELTTSNIQDYHGHLEWIHGINSKGEHIPRYKCSECNYESIRRNDMNRHVVLKHNKSKPFQCPHCRHTCSLKQNLKRHVRVVHGLELPSTKRSHYSVRLETPEDVQDDESISKEEVSPQPILKNSNDKKANLTKSVECP